MELSVLICTHDRAALLDQCLRALICATQEKPDEVVVVNGGRREADDVVARYQGRSGLPIRLVKTANKNLAASRNLGLPRCAGEIIAMTDDDAEVYPDWVTQIKRAHAEHPEAGAVGGRVIDAHPEALLSRLADRVTFPSFPTSQAVRTLPGVNIAYKRFVVQRAGAQDETLFRGEDVDFNWRVQRLGYSIWYDPAMRVRHHHRPTLRGFLHQHHMYGRAYYRVRRKWPEMYCVYPHALTQLRDVLKAANFGVAALYEPLRQMPRLRPADWLLAYPLFLAHQCAWRSGMLVQWQAERRRRRASPMVPHDQ